MSDVATVVVALVANILALAIVAAVVVAIVRRRSRGGGVTLSVHWHNEGNGREGHSHVTPADPLPDDEP